MFIKIDLRQRFSLKDVMKDFIIEWGSRRQHMLWKLMISHSSCEGSVSLSRDKKMRIQRACGTPPGSAASGKPIFLLQLQVTRDRHISRPLLLIVGLWWDCTRILTMFKPHL